MDFFEVRIWDDDLIYLVGDFRSWECGSRSMRLECLKVSRRSLIKDIVVGNGDMIV